MWNVPDDRSFDLGSSEEYAKPEPMLVRPALAYGAARTGVRAQRAQLSLARLFRPARPGLARRSAE